MVKIMENHGKSPFLIGKPSINGPFSSIFHSYVSHNQRVYSHIFPQFMIPKDLPTTGGR